MSGFGFGQQQQQQQQPQPPFGNSGGSGGGGGFFGSPPAAAPFGMAPQPAPFGNAPAAPSFGNTAAATATTTTSTTTFGTAAATSTAFAAPATTSFGGLASAAAAAAPSSGFGGTSSSSSTGFGQPTTGFGQPTTGFGQASTGFGQPSNPFAGSSQQQQQQQAISSNVPNPFGGPVPPPSGGISFAAPASSAFNSNNKNNPPAPAVSSGGGMTFGIPQSSSGFGSNNYNDNSSMNPKASSFVPSNPFGGGAPAPTFGNGGGGMTFGSSTMSAAPGHNHSTSIDMGSASNSPTPLNNNSSVAFGTPFYATDNNSAGFGTGGLGSIPEDSNFNPFGSVVAPEPSPASASAQKLAKLKAKLEAKKKKLLEQKRREQDSAADGPPQPQDEQSQSFPPPARDRRHKEKDKSHRRKPSTSPVPFNSNSSSMTDDQQARAERNLQRFATDQKTSTRVHLPSELQGQSSDAPKRAVTSAVGGESQREDLASAKSLEGTCQFFCPDEELLRREGENDIQLLEVPDPGGIHPADWTLRNTAVKRFRRSAADYKLDVPEWVRPPDVLEETCAYLEEWVMERDRQGPDRRFPPNLSNNGTPNSMDAYQFIWDRTRMIRKDFILQNFVGTGGKCDARAVRCHERIARWHAMCEHQLSHINEFAVHQSQQNIQELGQAMKTLNQYYDDSMGRALVEVPDEQGRETRLNPGDFAHGCKSDVVQGKNPIDYDGSPLNNVPEAAAGRLIGKNMVYSPTRGTAEPEMRALYILMVMNNEGGMEVMKYSAKLFRERPEIYYSKPVQLALNIFKAKKDYNYVRFFHYLRSPDTPYLFACIMFKHVEMMRKLAFKIGAKTYGARKKDTGEPIYDSYPLQKLAHLLCFEDMDEARAACKHYNITVKEMKVKSSSSGQVGKAEIIFWKASEFREARDPEKGTILPLRPRKMMRTIESKLRGTTRLGVCRGEVSGEGASLTDPPAVRMAPPDSLSQAVADASAVASGLSAAELMKRQQELFLREQEAAEARRKEAEKLRLKRDQEQRDQKRLEEIEKRKAAERERIKQLNREQEEKKQEEERKRLAGIQRQEEIKEQQEREERERLEKEAQEAARRKEEERQRQLAEAARKKAEAEEKERHRLEAIRLEEERRQQAIRNEEDRLRKAEEARKREEEERQRLEELLRQEEERRYQEEIAWRRAQELQDRVNKARKLLLLRRWKEKLPQEFKTRLCAQQSIQRIDPTFLMASPNQYDFLNPEITLARSPAKPKSKPTVVNTRKALNRILAKNISPLNVASVMLDTICSDEELMQHMQQKGYASNTNDGTKATFLFKVAVILPEPEGLEEDSMFELIHAWLSKNLQYGTVNTVQRVDPTTVNVVEVRVLFVQWDANNPVTGCDAGLFVIPPAFCNGDWSNSRKVEAISSAFDCMDHETPRVAYILAEKFDSDFYAQANEFLTACLPNASEEIPVVFPSAVSEFALDGSLKMSLRSLIDSILQEFHPVVERVSVLRLASRCISDTLWKSSSFDALQSAGATLLELHKELESAGRSMEQNWVGWPGNDFAGSDGLVRGYFGEHLHLPTSWTSRVFRDTAMSRIMDLHALFQKSVAAAVHQLLVNARKNTQQECQDMLEKRQYRKCLQHALQFSDAEDDILYLPRGTACMIAMNTIESIIGSEAYLGTALSEDPEYDPDIARDTEGMQMQQQAVFTTPLSQRDNIEAVDEKNVVQEAQDIFAKSRTISPAPPLGVSTPAGMMTPPTTLDDSTPAPVGTISPLPTNNNKRHWTDSNYDDAKTKRSRSHRSSMKKSRAQRESSAFTKKLQALLKGEATVDMMVGNTTLAKLVRNTPLLKVSQEYANNDHQGED